MHIDRVAAQRFWQLLARPGRGKRHTELPAPDDLLPQEERIAGDPGDDIGRLEQKVDEHRGHGRPLGHGLAPAAGDAFSQSRKAKSLGSES